MLGDLYVFEDVLQFIHLIMNRRGAILGDAVFLLKQIETKYFVEHIQVLVDDLNQPRLGLDTGDRFKV